MTNTAKTWPYNTRLPGVVVDVIPGDRGLCPYAVVCESHGDGFIMTGVEHDIEPRKGEQVVMQFMEGGPAGGYWKIISLAE